MAATTYTDATNEALYRDCAFLRQQAARLNTAQTAIFENDEARVKIVAWPDGQVSLHHNPGMLMSVFARIMAEEEAE
jgi:hypothetical protein